MASRNEIVAEARAWLGVPWRHQGRSRDGVDCVGLLIVVARALALLPIERLDAIERETAGYSRYPRGDRLRLVLEQHLQPVQIYRPGDALLFRIDSDPQHLALIADHPAGGLSIVHAYALRPHCVVEHALDRMWESRAVAAYALPGAA